MKSEENHDDGGAARLAGEVAAALRARGLRLAVAESCSGGWIAKVCTDPAGASDWFCAGLVTYSNDAKRDVLGVAPQTLARHGAVSEAVVKEMTAGVLARIHAADVALAVSGVAGPGGGGADKPVGCVWIAWQRRGQGAVARRFDFAGGREAVRRAAVAEALRGVLEHGVA